MAVRGGCLCRSSIVCTPTTAQQGPVVSTCFERAQSRFISSRLSHWSMDHCAASLPKHRSRLNGNRSPLCVVANHRSSNTAEPSVLRLKQPFASTCNSGAYKRNRACSVTVPITAVVWRLESSRPQPLSFVPPIVISGHVKTSQSGLLNGRK